MSTNIFNSSIAGLNTAQKALETISNNIANVNTENYSKRVIHQAPRVVDNKVQGVEVSRIERNVDQMLVDSVRDENSHLVYLGTLNDYYQQIQLMLGSPGDDNNVVASLNSFFSSLKSLAVSPSQPSLHLNVVQKGVAFTNMLSTLADNLHELRYKADQEITNSVNSINSILTELHKCNTTLGNLNNIHSDNTAALEERDILLKKLATYLDIYTYYSKSGEVAINAVEGKGLLDFNYTYTLNYIGASSKESFINNISMQPITISINDNNGKPVNTPPVTLVTSGTGEAAGMPNTITTPITEGAIKALLEMRDQKIPELLDMFDNLAYTITQEINKIHNNGSGFPPPTELTGTRPTTLDELHNWNGEVMIGLVNDEGLPLQKADGSYLKPLTLDLSRMRSGSIDGQFSSRTLINEINQYFYDDQINNRLELGNLSNIKMVAYNDLTTAPNGQFNFDFELDNNDQLGSDFKILEVNVTDSGCAGLISTLPGKTLINAGQSKRTSLPLTVDFAGGAGGPYTVNVVMEVTDTLGNTSVASVNFIIDDSNSSVENTRYIASSVSSGPAAIKPAGTTQGFAYASFVDAEGNEINDSTSSGFLNISTSNKHFHISINELTSKELGAVNTNVRDSITNKGLSAFFELNDLFVRNTNINKNNNNPAIHNNALNLKIRQDIINTPEHLSVGQLIQSSPIKEQQLRGYEKAHATFAFDSNPALGDTLIINGQTFTFDTTNSDNTIEVGSTLADTLNNMVQVLSEENPYTSGNVNNALYTSGDNNLYISFKASGVGGNSFMLAANFATITASINNGDYVNNPSGSLVGGSSTMQVVDVQPWTYELGISGNQAVSELAALENKDIYFAESGNLISTTVNFNYYLNTIIATHSTTAANTNSAFKSETMSYFGYMEKLSATSGVNLDEELMNSMKFAKAYSAMAKMIQINTELIDQLLAVL